MISQPNSLFLKSITRHFLSKPLHFSPFVPRNTRLTKQECIRHLKSCKSMQELKQIQSQAFRIGLHQNKDVLNKLLVVCTDPSQGNLRYAQRVFHYIEDPHLFVYNVMIKAFAKAGRFRRAIMLFDELRMRGLWPDNFTYPFVFKSIGCLKEALVGGKVHGFVLKCGVEFDCYVCNSLMDMYAELCCVGNLRKVFDEIPERDVVSWNVLISGYVRCGQFEDAVSAFRRMQRVSTVKPDEATVVSTLTACAALKNLERGMEIHRYVYNELGFTTIISNALLEMYSKCGCLSTSQQIFDAMPEKNVVCWTSMVSGYVNYGQLDKARDLFERSPVRDIVLWTAMINGYVQFNRVEEAVALFRNMQMERLKPDKFVLVALLTGCAEVGALEQGQWIHGYIDENKITLDAVVGTALINMYSKCGCIGKSLEIFRVLKEKDTASWTSIICGLAMNGKATKALDLFSEMERARFRPDDITFIGVLSACSHGGLVEEGQRYFNSMRRNYQLVPKLEHYGCLIDLLGRAGLLNEAEELIEKAPKENNETIVPLYGALLSACRTYGNVDMGKRVARRLVQIENSDSSIHTLLANIYASADKWEDVTKVRKKMKALGVRKAPGCSSIEVDGSVHEFLVGDASHPDMKEVYAMLNSFIKPLSGMEEIEKEKDNSVAEIHD